MANLVSITQFHNLDDGALADLIGDLDGHVKGLEARIVEAKAELKARGVKFASGSRFSVTRCDAARITLDSSAIRKAMGDAWCGAYERIAAVTSFRIGAARPALAA